MTEELKPLPCPFCGSKMITHFGDYAVCNNCGAQGPSGEDQSHGTLTWNTRSPAWRDIESAPRDGTKVLLWATRLGWEDAGPNIVVGKAVPPLYRTWGVTGAADGGIMDGATHDSCIPTHWMPLPLPPEEGRG